MTWLETNDKLGHRPEKPLVCPFCQGMLFPRASRFRQLAHNRNAWVDDRTYKCRDCHAVFNFGIPVSADYAAKIIGLRGEPSYLPIEEWLEDEELKKRLESLGYV